MTFYTTTGSMSTGTYSNYSNYYQEGTTAAGTLYNNWNYFSYMSTGQYANVDMGTGYISPHFTRYESRQEAVIHKPSEQELLRQREADAKAKKEREEMANAERKARVLLSEYLDYENRQRLIDKQPLEIPSGLFEDIKYQIPISYDRIKALKENKIITELCLSVKTSESLPMDDIILTKLLHVIHDEENMLRTANHVNRQENLLARLN